jgi:hypothetical protein
MKTDIPTTTDSAVMAVAKSALRYWRELENIRVHKAQRIYFWLHNYEDMIKGYIVDNMKKMFSDDTISEINIRIFNIVPRVVDKLGFVYKESPERMLDGGLKSVTINGKSKDEQSEDDKRYQLMLQKSNIVKKQNEWNKESKPFNTLLIQPIWQEDVNDKTKSYMDFLIHTPAWTVVTPDPNNYLMPQSFYYPIWMQLVPGTMQEQALVYWSKDEHFLLDALENKKYPEGNPQGKNPYGILPVAVLRLKDGIDFFGEGWWDLIQFNEEVCEQVSNLFYISKFQLHGQPVATNIGESIDEKGNDSNTKPRLGPGNLIRIGDGQKHDETPAKIEFIQAHPELKAVQDLIDWSIKTMQALKGLSPQQYSLETTLASGRSKLVDSEEINEIRKNDMNILQQFESDLYEVTRVVYNYHNPNNKISDKAVFSIKFQEPKIPESAQELTARRTFNLANYIQSPVDFIMEDYPDLTREEAQAKYEENVTAIRQMKDESGMNDVFTKMVNGGNQTNTNNNFNNQNNPSQPSAMTQNQIPAKG